VNKGGHTCEQSGSIHTHASGAGRLSRAHKSLWHENKNKCPLSRAALPLALPSHLVPHHLQQHVRHPHRNSRGRLHHEPKEAHIDPLSPPPRVVLVHLDAVREHAVRHEVDADEAQADAAGANEREPDPDVEGEDGRENYEPDGGAVVREPFALLLGEPEPEGEGKERAALDDYDDGSYELGVVKDVLAVKDEGGLEHVPGGHKHV